MFSNIVVPMYFSLKYQWETNSKMNSNHSQGRCFIIKSSSSTEVVNFYQHPLSTWRFDWRPAVQNIKCKLAHTSHKNLALRKMYLFFSGIWINREVSNTFKLELIVNFSSTNWFVSSCVDYWQRMRINVRQEPSWHLIRVFRILVLEPILKIKLYICTYSSSSSSNRK